MVRQTGKTAGVAVAALIGLSLGGAALAAPGDPWDDRGSYRGDIYHRHDRPDAARHPARMQPDPLWQHRQNVHRQELAVRHHPGPVYADRPWHGHYGNRAIAHRSGSTIVYRNIYHYVTVPQPVYVRAHPGYYDGPYESYGYRHSACNSQAVGTVIGAILGGVIGADQGRGAGPVIGGALIGAVLGGALGHAIDASNWACIGDVLEYAPNRRPVSWHDAQTGYGYEVTPMRTFEAHPGRYCREYQTVVTIGGRAEEAYGTACRQPDGAWEIVNS
ncbi:MAG: RT0821/Lpp0805 family surface protein [Parvibaculum sp.]|uniref:RT0821/Lpp0805 family surface protein n=1 Tax=Parvibaculum sp. TaxID=2024848 RepID=UPI0032EFBE93